MEFIEPKVFIIAQTQLNAVGVNAMLDYLGVPDWTTDAESDGEALMEIAGKMCYMSFSTDLNQNLTKVGTRSNFDYLQDGIIGTGHGCYDPETEVLTSEGWRFWPDVVEGDFLATRTSDGALEYHLPKGLIAAPYTGRMYRVDSQGVDLLVTDNHNMLVCKTTTVAGRKKEDFGLTQAKELGHVSHAYVKTADWVNAPSGTPIGVYTLLGFAIGDGNVSDSDKAGVRFRLRRERKISFLQGVCTELGWGLSFDGVDRFRVAVPTEFRGHFNSLYLNGEKVIPTGLLMVSSKQQLEALFMGLMQSDGHRGKTGDCYDTTSQVLAGQVQQLCLHIGLAANVVYTYTKEGGHRGSSFGDKPLIRLSIIRRELKPEVNKFIGGVGRTSWVEGWEGMVYCAEVPNNTLYVRRNGIPVWCGNSVLEHSTITLAFMDVSRVLTHELVRHRAGAAYSQTSGRYVRTDILKFFLPKVIKENIELAEEFDKAISYQEIAVKRMAEIARIDNMKTKEEFVLKKWLTSAFRRIIGNGVANNIIATFNHRALRNIIAQRTSRHAEEEIRLVFNSVFDQVANMYPAIYADAHREMVDGLWEVTFKAGKV